MLSLLLALAAAPRADVPRETVIRYAANGGIRNVETGPPGSDIVYLQDRTLRWYRVTMTGPCLPDRSLQTIAFRTDALGTFDRFSQIVSLRFPDRACGVRSIVASDAPPAQPPGVKHRR